MNWKRYSLEESGTSARNVIDPDKIKSNQELKRKCANIRKAKKINDRSTYACRRGLHDRTHPISELEEIIYAYG